MAKRTTTIDQFRIRWRPNYVPQEDEEVVFRAAFESDIPLILKGPTGCGKTRFIEYMAHELGLPLVTVSCHEDLTGADLVLLEHRSRLARRAAGKGKTFVFFGKGRMPADVTRIMDS